MAAIGEVDLTSTTRMQYTRRMMDKGLSLKMLYYSDFIWLNTDN